MSELENIRHAVGRVIPDYVDHVEYTLDADATGDPAVWIYIILKDEVVKDASFFDRAETVRQAVVEALNGVDTHRWPYVHFTSVSEHAAEHA